MESEMYYKCRLYVGNISFRLNENDITDMFSAAGAVTDVYLPRIYKTRKHKGYAFVEMSDIDGARKAISLFHKQPDLYGRHMIVRFADIRLSKEELEEKRNKNNNNKNERV